MTEKEALASGWIKIYRPEVYEFPWIDPNGIGYMELPISKTVEDCKKRFKNSKSIPFGGFPKL